jgi:hypothetical protein
MTLVSTQSAWIWRLTKWTQPIRISLCWMRSYLTLSLSKVMVPLTICFKRTHSLTRELLLHLGLSIRQHRCLIAQRLQLLIHNSGQAKCLRTKDRLEITTLQATSHLVVANLNCKWEEIRKLPTLVNTRIGFSTGQLLWPKQPDRRDPKHLNHLTISLKQRTSMGHRRQALGLTMGALEGQTLAPSTTHSVCSSRPNLDIRGTQTRARKALSSSVHSTSVGLKASKSLHLGILQELKAREGK